MLPSERSSQRALHCIAHGRLLCRSIRVLSSTTALPDHPAAAAAAVVVIVGDDADLILMALVSNTPRLYILNSALSGNELSPKTAVLSVDKLHQTWLKNGTAGIRLTQQQLQQQTQGLSEDLLLRLLGAKADLALLAIMSSGNDYLPAVKGAPKLETLWAR